MHIGLNCIEGVFILRDILLHKAINILDRIQLGRLPVMRAVDKRVLQMPDFKVQVIEGNMELVAQHANRFRKLVVAREQLDTGDSVHIGSIIKLNIKLLRF